MEEGHCVSCGSPLQIDGSKAKSALLINATKDGATPYAGALAVRAEEVELVSLRV